MPHVTLRIHSGKTSTEDLLVTVKDNTYEYLMVSTAPKIRVSAYFDRDWPRVEAHYEELFVNENCPFKTKIMKIIPGSRARSKITLPNAMKEGEQLVIEVTRTPAR